MTRLVSLKAPDLPPDPDAVRPRSFSKRVIPSCTAGKGALLTRYHLIATQAFGVYIHHLHVSDEDRALHDHPWSFLTFLVSSGYWEWTGTSKPGGRLRIWRRRFSVIYHPAEFAHRLELVRPTWTIVVRFRVRRSWGFFSPSGWRPWRDYGREYCD